MESSRFRKIIVIISYLCVAKQARIWIINFNQPAYSNIPQAKYELYNVTGWCYMAKVEDCPGFETFGADVKAAREAKRLARKTLAEMVGIEWRYLANIENQGAIPSLPVMIQLIKVCGLPVERYFNPEIMREESEQRQRVSHKLKLCPEEYLPIIEGAIDGALKMEQTAKQKEDA